MSTNIIQNEKSFIPIAAERDKGERLNRLFASAEGHECIERRSKNAKVFDLGAGRTQVVTYSEPVHYLENGEWKEIDNTLVESHDDKGRPIFINKANPIQMRFPSHTGDGMKVSISHAGHTFSWGFEYSVSTVEAATRTGADMRQHRLAERAATLPKYVGLTKTNLMARDLAKEMESPQQRRGDLTKLDSESTYANLLPGISVRYTLSGQSVKEDIILDHKDALAQATLRLPREYEYEITENNGLIIKKDGEKCFSMATPYVYDAKGKQTVATVALTDRDSYVRLSYDIDDDFMNSASFPITIDPLVNTQDAVHNIQDTTLTEGSTATPYTANHLFIGKYGGMRNVALLKFNEIPIPQAKDALVNAQLEMVCVGSTESPNYISVHEILRDWQSNAVHWYNANPYNPENVSDDAVDCVEATANTWVTFDVTSLYRKWCTKNGGVSQNYGIALRSPTNINTNNYSALMSSDGNANYRPVLYVNYVSHAGIEGWWHYETMSAGRASVYADIFNGNTVVTHSDTVMTGNRTPISVSHAYNSALCSTNEYGCGFGWKTDANQKVKKIAWSDRQYYAWEDGDGTQHYFPITGTEPYKDEEGMELELTTSVNYLMITDKQGNRLNFRKVSDSLARLYQCADALDTNIATYYYVNNDFNTGLVDRIVDPVGRVTQFTYTNNLLSSIQIPDTDATTHRYVYFTYDTGNRLTGVRYTELGGTNNHLVYCYDGSTNILTTVRYYDGVQVNIAYEAADLYNSAIATNTVDNQMRRVLSLETVATDDYGTVMKHGAKEIFTYKHMCTEVTAVESEASDSGKKLYYQFNDAGNVVCVRDELGFGSFTKYESSIENKPSESSKLRKAVINLLRTPDLSANWAGVNAATDSTVRCLSAPSVKLTPANGGAYYRQSVVLAPNTTYTFSAYVKTTEISGMGAYLQLSKGTDVVKSYCLTGTTDAAIGNDLPSDGWERLRVIIHHTANVAETYNADMIVTAASGTAWFACPQLEVGPLANNFNVVSNGDFSMTYVSGNQTLPLDWAKSPTALSTANTGVVEPDSSFPEALSGKALAIEGVPNGNLVAFKQTFDLVGKAGDLYTVGGWGNSHSVPQVAGKFRFCFAMRLQKLDGTWSGYIEKDFNEEWVGWQFANFSAVAGYDYQKIELFLGYCYNCNISQFSNIFLYREAFGESFAYDDDKNLVAVTNLSGEKSKAEYDSAKNVTKYTQPGRDADVADNQYWAYYGDNDAERKKHLAWRTRTPMHMLDCFSYDSYGNEIAKRRLDYRVYTGNTQEDAYPFIRSETTYTADGNFSATSKDARGNVATQNVNTSDGTLTSATDPNNQTVNYTYDAAKHVTGVQTTGDGKTYRNGYTYENDRIKTVSHNTTSDTTNDVTYTFDYDELGRKTTVKVGTQTLSTNVYTNDRNGMLSEVQYGNGGKMKYAYDEYDRLTGVKYDDAAENRFIYEYGANGRVAEVTDMALNRITRTDLDLADRPCQTELKDTNTGEVLYRTVLKYDKLNNLQQFAEKVGGEAHTSDYTYDRDNRVTEMAYDGATHKVGYTYDELGRVTERTVNSGVTNGKLTSTFTYVDGGYESNSTTPLVAGVTHQVGGSPVMSFAYGYDTRANIITEARNGIMATYVYDSMSQLVRANDPNDKTSGDDGTTWTYEYDRGGNIIKKRRYSYTTGVLGAVLDTKSYAYANNGWKDQLTSYDGHHIIYDEIGNPSNDGTWTYTWEHGRQLKRMDANGGTVKYKYDHNGMRIEKVFEADWYPETTRYILHGKLITHMTVNYTDHEENQQQDILHFYYDDARKPSFVKYNGTMYRYLYSLQGDIVGIIDESGAIVVEYKYDPWGNSISTSGWLAETLGKRNPFRYRGYVYDVETGLYCLVSRYYDAKIGRFINPDELIGDISKLHSHNTYAYCENSPVSNADSNGAFSFWAGLAIVATAVVATVIVAAAAPAAICAISVDLAVAGLSYGAAQATATAVVAVAGAVTVASAADTATVVTTGDSYIRKALGDEKYEYFQVASLVASAGLFTAAAASPGVCFVAGTPVATETGLVPIERIQAGQLVWAEDPETGERALKQVVRSFINEKDELVHVRVNGETITCTTEHPFYVHGMGWVAARQLKAGDKVELHSGENAYVDAVEYERLVIPIQVYNFEVEGFHTYYVGSACVLVHNRCLLGKRLAKIEPDPGKGYHAHHTLPQEFEEQFLDLEIDINEGRFGVWVESKAHLRFSRAYNEEWRCFLRLKPTREQALAFGREMAKRYGYKVRY